MKKAKSMIDFCDMSSSSSLCTPACINNYQINNMTRCDKCVYHKKDGKIKKINENESEQAYLYISPDESNKISKKALNKIAKSGVRELFIYKQQTDSLRCEHLDTMILEEFEEQEEEKEEIDWLFYFFIFLVFIIFASLIFYYFSGQTYNSESLVGKTQILNRMIE